MHVVGFSFSAIWIVLTFLGCIAWGGSLILIGLLCGRPGFAFMGCGVLLVPFVVAKLLSQ